MYLLLSRGALIAALLAIAPLIVGFALKLDLLRELWRAAAVTAAVFVLVFRDELESRDGLRTEVAAGVLLAVVAGAALAAVYAAWWNHTHMREYDFFALYMDARVAWERLDFYEPANYQAIYSAMPPPFAELHPGFQRNVLEVGTKYPPPTMFYLMPFGALDRLPAHIAWVAVSWIAIAGCILMVWRGVFRSSSLLVLLAVTALILANPGAKLTLSLEQTHFTALALVLGAVILRHHAIAGALVGIGTLIKPPVAALALYLLYAKRWSGIGALIATAVITCIASILVFGWDVFARFFTDNPNLRVSNSLFFEDMNQSLQGTIVRAIGWDFAKGAPMQHPAFLAAAGAIVSLTALGWWVARGKRTSHVLILLLCFGLLLYPGTQRHYSVLLLAPVTLFIVTADRDGWRRLSVAVLCSAVVVFGVSHTLWSVLALWIATLVMIAARRGLR